MVQATPGPTAHAGANHRRGEADGEAAAGGKGAVGTDEGGRAPEGDGMKPGAHRQGNINIDI